MSSLSLDVRASKQPVALFALSLVVGTITSAYIGMVCLNSHLKKRLFGSLCGWATAPLPTHTNYRRAICFLSVRTRQGRSADRGQGPKAPVSCPQTTTLLAPRDRHGWSRPCAAQALPVTEGHGIPASLTPSSRDRCHTPSCAGFSVTGNRDGKHAGKAACLRVTRLRRGLVGGLRGRGLLRRYSVTAPSHHVCHAHTYILFSSREIAVTP